MDWIEHSNEMCEIAQDCTDLEIAILQNEQSLLAYLGSLACIRLAIERLEQEALQAWREQHNLVRT